MIIHDLNIRLLGAEACVLGHFCVEIDLAGVIRSHGMFQGILTCNHKHFCPVTEKSTASSGLIGRPTNQCTSRDKVTTHKKGVMAQGFRLSESHVLFPSGEVAGRMAGRPTGIDRQGGRP